MVLINNILGSEMYLVAGSITKYSEGSGNAAGKVINLKLDNEIDVAFWNGDEKDKKLASRLKMANVRVGSFISVLVTFKDEKKTKATALNFKYGGIWMFKEKAPTPNVSGIVEDVVDEKDSVTVKLDSGDNVVFANEQKGYRFADRIRGIEPGDELFAVTDGDTLTNFRVSDGNWNISRSISAVIGTVSFLDEGKTKGGSEYIRLNISIYKGKDSNGKSVYENAYVYFDNKQNNTMIESVKKNVKRKQHIAVVCGKNKVDDNSDNVYTGYYFKEIGK